MDLTSYTMSTAKAAERLGVALSTVSRWADEGRIPCARTAGGWRRFRPEDINSFADQMREGAA